MTIRLPAFKQDRFYFHVIAAALFLAVLWSGRNVLGLTKNILDVRRLERSIEALKVRQKTIETELNLLEHHDSVAWDRMFRLEAHALKPGELEYRIQY